MYNPFNSAFFFTVFAAGLFLACLVLIANTPRMLRVLQVGRSTLVIGGVMMACVGLIGSWATWMPCP